MITRKMRLSMAMLTIAASVLTTGNIKADEKDTTKETNTATESKYANKAVADIYSTTTLNIRKKGSINAKIVGKMKKGNIATVLKKGSEWSKVRSGNVTGYVKNQYLVFGDEIENFAKQNVKKVVKVQTETLRVRKKASTNSKIVTLVSEDDKLKVKKQTDDWAKVKVDGQIGYVSKDYAKVTYSFGKAKSMKQIQREVALYQEQQKRHRNKQRKQQSEMSLHQHQAVILQTAAQHQEVQKQVLYRRQRKLPYQYHPVVHQQQEAESQVMPSSLLEIHIDMVETA